MPKQPYKSAVSQRLRASPSFALNFAMDGHPYVAKDVEPYIQYWLTERDRVLLSMFSNRRGATVDEAIEGYLRLTRVSQNLAERKRLLKAIDDMRSAGVIIGARDDTSRYTSKIVEAYVAHRPFPRELSDLIIRSAPVRANCRVLDLAGGPGDLALALASVSDQVSMMDLSRGFVNAAAKRAKQLGRNLTPIHESCNRLVFRDEEYDVVTISQALHWLDDVMVCRGLCRCLRPGGSFFVIQGAFDVDVKHPLSYLLRSQSILGHKAPQSFATQIGALLKRLTLLFDALDAPDVQRVDLAQQWATPGTTPAGQIVPVGVSMFRQARPMGLGFARAFVTPQHIAPTGQTPAAFWKDAEARCHASKPKQLIGTYNWAVLHFQRGAVQMTQQPIASLQKVEIGYDESSAA